MSSFRIEKLNTVVIPVKDLEKSINFYENVLRLQKQLVDGDMAFFNFGQRENETTIMLHIIDKPEPVEKGIVIELQVDDIKLAVTSIKEAGGIIIQEPINQDWGVIEAVIADPDNYRIWLVQPINR